MLEITTHKLKSLLALLRATREIHLTSHWQASGDNSYGDHLLFERLYTGMEKEIDGLAEKMIPLCGADSVTIVTQTRWMANYAADIANKAPAGLPRSIEAENCVKSFINDCLNSIDEEPEQPVGLVNFLEDLMEPHDTALYLMGQRSSGDKVARRVASKYIAGLSTRLQQAKQFASRFRLDNFLYDDTSLNDEYLKSLSEFFDVMSWAAGELDKYGPDGPSGQEVAKKLINNQAAKTIATKRHIQLGDILEVIEDDMDPDVLKKGLAALRQHLNQPSLAVEPVSVSGQWLMSKLKSEKFKPDRYDQSYVMRSAEISGGAMHVHEYKHVHTGGIHYVVVWYTGNPGGYRDSKTVDTIAEVVAVVRNHLIGAIEAYTV